jgi:ribosomal protein S18 acetylase RimI-like enzyme
VRIEALDPGAAPARAILRRYWDEIITRYHDRPATEAEIDSVDAAYPPDVTVLLVAFDGDEPAGCVGLREPDAGRGEVTKLFVVATARGGGLGERLMTALEATARERGLRELILYTRHDLVEAQRLYLRLGYERAEPFREETYGDRWFRKPLA